MHRFCQEIDKARAEGRLHRPLEVTFLAYADVLEPPTRPLPGGISSRLCMATFYPIRRCYVHHFDDPACPANDQVLTATGRLGQDPQRHYRGQIAIGEYYNVSGLQVPADLLHAHHGPRHPVLLRDWARGISTTCT